MTWMLQYCLHILFSLAFTAKVTVDFNQIATSDAFGIVCIVKGREKESLIKIHKDELEKVTISDGCVIKSTDPRLNIGCTETGDDIQLNVNLLSYDSSELGIWNCSHGDSYDTIKAFRLLKMYNVQQLGNLRKPFACQAHKECNILLNLNISQVNDNGYSVSKILKNGTFWSGQDWKVRTHAIKTSIVYLIFSLTDVNASDGGIYYLFLDTNNGSKLFGFSVKISDYPEKPVISLQLAGSNVGMYELLCTSEAKSQPLFARKQLSFTWRINGHNLKEVKPCFRLRGPVLMLCPDACDKTAKGDVSVTCSSTEDDLQSTESQPYIISISSGSASGFNTPDHQTHFTVVTLVGACLGSLITGILLAVFTVLSVTKRSSYCIKEHHAKKRTSDVNSDSAYISPIMLDTHQAPDGEVRQYESLNHSAIENCQNQYDVIHS